jgi:hypothetical protein
MTQICEDTMADLTTLKTRLAELEESFHRLLMNDREVKVSTIGKAVEYGQTDAATLEVQIAKLRSEIDRLSGRPRGPIYLSC